MSLPETSVITRYFEADARRDIDAIVALFSDEAVVVDEGQTYHGPKEIRSWRERVASAYQYTTQVQDTKWCIRQVQATFGSCAIPNRLRGRCLRLLPHT
jgi:ketosteroid isomerase-like protein